MIPTLVVLAYLALVLYIGIFAFRRSAARQAAEDYFLAGRSLGPFVFLFSLFGTNMTAFTILGASGHAFNHGIVTYGLMASSSALIIPLTLLLIGTRTWALGKKHGFMTPVQMFRDRWECRHIGTAIFALQALFLIPYIIIAVKGGGTILQSISGGLVPYWLGGSLVALVVMSYVFFGGMRGTAWVNTFQTTLFLSFGAAALLVIGGGMGGLQRSHGKNRPIPRPGASAHPGKCLTALFPQLHLHTAVLHLISPHRHLLPYRPPHGPVPQDGDPLSHLYPGHLASLRLSGSRRQWSRRFSPNPTKAGRPSNAGGLRDRADPGTGKRPPAPDGCR